MGTHPIFESDFDCLTECKTDEKMSWLQNLAKKGENFLDQLDQQAGAAIEQAEVKIKGQNETDRDGEGYSPSKRISPMATMDRRLNTGGMSRSMSDRHLANHAPISTRINSAPRGPNRLTRMFHPRQTRSLSLKWSAGPVQWLEMIQKCR